MNGKLRSLAGLALIFVACLLVGCSGGRKMRDRAMVLVSSEDRRIVLSGDLQLRQLAPSVWLHASRMEVPEYGRVPANGLVVIGESSVLLVDTPWTEEQTRTLVAWLQETLEKPVTDVVFTHSHEDSTGGVAALPEGARLHALASTAELSAEAGRPFEAVELPPEGKVEFAGAEVETFFPGPGHAPDNVVVWLPEDKLLFGGCFVKWRRAEDLGNVADADLESWRAGIERVQQRYPKAERVIPGHGYPGDAELLEHTRALIDAALEQTPTQN